MYGTISHASRRPPDVILRRSFTRPSTALAVIEGLGTRLHSIQVSCVPTSSSVYDPHTGTGDGTTHWYWGWDYSPVLGMGLLTGTGDGTTHRYWGWDYSPVLGMGLLTGTGDGTTHQHGPAAAPVRPLPLTSEACHCCPVQKLWPPHPCKK